MLDGVDPPMIKKVGAPCRTLRMRRSDGDGGLRASFVRKIG